MGQFQTLDNFLKEYEKLPSNCLFKMSYELTMQECDCKGFIQISSLMRILQTAAQKDMRSNGYDVYKDIESGYQWMVRYYKIAIERFPNPREEIKIFTWVSQISDFNAIRNFLITQGDQVIVKSASQWIIINKKSKRFEPMPETYRKNVWEMDLIDTNINKVSVKDHFIRESRVAYNMIDSNHHMNNAYYGLLATEAVEDEFRLHNVPYDFEIYFKKEAIFGEIIRVRTERIQNDTIHSLRNTSNTELSQIKIKWREF